MLNNRQFLLMILDGIGINEKINGNAFHLAKKPNIDRLLAKYPHSRLKSSGLAVGLPDGQMGNSEVGHANIGSGRIIYQELTRINKSIIDGDFFNNDSLLGAIKNAKKHNTALHLIGLVSDGGVHSHQGHLYALLKLAKDHGLKDVYVHAFLDGRDTSPSSALGYIKDLECEMKELNIGKIASISGRYFGMDRDNRWDRIKLSYDSIIHGMGKTSNSAQETIMDSYAKGVNDEFIEPVAITENGTPVAPVSDGDSVIMFNFRPDRSRQLAHAISDVDFTHFNRGSLANDLYVVSMTDYDSAIENVHIAYKPQSIVNSLGEYVSNLGYSQLRIAETEKYAHVTFFFNGGSETAYLGENRIVISSPDVSTYDLKPEMSAPEVTKNVVKAIDEGQYDLIVVNFANGDMVGHTGKLDKAIEAVEVLDSCVGKIIDALIKNNGEAIITADHGNCEYMIDDVSGDVITSHSTFDVPVIIVSDRIKKVSEGRLCDISPTILSMMGVDTPREMTGRSIIELNKEEN